MIVYGELDPTKEHRTQFAFKGSREHIVKVDIPNIAYPNQHTNIEIPYGSIDDVIVPDTVKITFNLDIESTDKTHTIVKNVGRALVKRKVLMFASKNIDMISNSDAYDTYKDLKADENDNPENAIKETFDKKICNVVRF